MPRSSTARARLIDSASRLMYATNYGAASVDALCADAGVLKGTFYYFFPSKRSLVLAAIDEQWVAARATILEPAFNSQLAPRDRFRRFFELVAGCQCSEVVRGCPFGNLAGEMGTTDPLIRAGVRRVFDGYRSYFQQALHDAATTAGSPGLAEVSGLAELVLASFQGMLLVARTRNDSSVIADVSDQLLASIFQSNRDQRRSA